MKIVDKMPKEGQFVAVWKYNGVTWSDTYRWVDGELRCWFISGIGDPTTLGECDTGFFEQEYNFHFIRL